MITNSQDFIDSRDVQERIDELALIPKDEIDGEDDAELTSLEKLKQAYISDYSEDSWKFGAFFINEDYMETYAREQPDNWFNGYNENQWPFNYIDWEEATEALKQDYTEIDFDGKTYYTQEA